MKSDFLGVVSKEICWFLLLAASVYGPLLLDLHHGVADDFRVRALFAQALALPSVQFDLLANLLGHLIPLAAVHVCVAWPAGRISRRHGVNASVVRALLLTCAWVLMVWVNQRLFPASDYAIGLDVLAGPVLPVAAILILTAALARALVDAVRPRTVALAASMTGIMGLLAMTASPANDAPPSAATGARHVFVLGVDSLSQGLMADSAEALPKLHALLEAGIRYERAYTPLGRTFPSWMSLLSGRSPAEHGALFNLRPIDRVERADLVSHHLREAGYRTVFAMDERRFSNLDESFGFDRVVGPKAGVLDFVLQRINDTPMTNLLLQTPLGDRLLPYSRYNVAAHASYDADGFVDALVESVRGAERVFVAAHFESAHFPYKTRHARLVSEDPNPFRRKHLQALGVVDAQIGRLIARLGQLGYLQDALVVLVSDHGEGFGETEAESTRHGEHFELSGFGHGGDVLSEAQNRIVLGLVPFRDGAPVRLAQARTEQVSMTDLRAAIESYVSSGEVAVVPRNACMFVETGLRLWATADYRTLDEATVAREGAGYYEVSTKGRMQLREDLISDLVASKDVGWRCADRITYFSSAHDRFFAYALGPGGELTELDPDLQDVERIRGYRNRLMAAVRDIRAESGAAGVLR